MPAGYSRWFLISLFFLATFFFASNAHTAKVSKEDQSRQTREAMNSLESKEVDGFLAGLTDAQTRELLQEKLKSDAALREKASHNAEGNVVLGVFLGLETSLRNYAAAFRTIVAAANAEAGRLPEIRDRFCSNNDCSSLATSLLSLTGVALLCVLAVLGLRKAVAPAFNAHTTSSPGRAPGKLLRFVLRLAFHFFSLCVFFALFSTLTLFLLSEAGPEKIIGSIFLVTLTYVLALQIIAMLLLSPDAAHLRPIPIENGPALSLYRGLMTITYGVGVLGFGSAVLAQVGGAPVLGRILHASAGLYSGLVLSFMIFSNRSRVSEALGGTDESPLTFPALLARFWHYPALAYALFVGIFWSLRALTVQEPLARLVLSLFVIPACIGLDLWIRELVALASRPADLRHVSFDPEASDKESPSDPAVSSKPTAEKSVRDFYPLLHKLLRIALFILPVFLMLRMWGVDIPLGWLFARNVLSILFVIVTCLLVWEISRVYIDRRLHQEMVLSGAFNEDMDEGGGSGGSRSATLLLLLRKFVLTVLVVLGTLMGLSALGVDIAPLIAGAGVFGLAIGFGAQTLVKDIISGIFFLIDDAFRVGDYVEAGTAKGTVEHISLRSMKLRHPRGMVFNVPFGSLKILQNFSRDFIITKLDFRIRYDADIDKIRKVIKRVNKEMQADAEFSSALLSDIKSNGVRSMEDSAMILRIKFKSIPGHQFVLQKEVYRRVQEAFRKNGIEFAHRNVTVYLPPEVQALLAKEPEHSQQLVGAAIGAAASTAVLVDEEEKAKALAAAAAKGQSGDE